MHPKSLGPIALAVTAALFSCKSRQADTSTVQGALIARNDPKRAPVDPEPNKPWGVPLASHERRLTILGTNDIHGGLEPTLDGDNSLVGGMPVLGGVVNAIRTGLAAREGDAAAVLVVDGGDQFQGTLPSNTNEGVALMEAMNAIGYTAVVPGNHDYDFGPIGWKADRSPDPKKRLEVVERAAKISKAPFISANTFLKESIVFGNGTPKGKDNVDGINCQPKGTAPGSAMVGFDLAAAKRPAFIKPYALVKGPKDLKVALIGLDNPSTPTSTTGENVEDFCFADEFTVYKAMYAEVKAKGADMVVLVLHDGNSNNEASITELIKKIKEEEKDARQRANDPQLSMVDAVVSAHTHYSYATYVEGVPLIQSGSGGAAFGRIDLIWDATAKRVDAAKTKVAGGVLMYADACDPLLLKSQGSFCAENGGSITMEGQAVMPDAKVTAIVKQARDDIPKFEPLAAKPLGQITADLFSSYERETALADVLTDALRKSADHWLAAKAGSGGTAPKVDVSFINTSGIRAPIRKKTKNPGPEDFTFEDLFKVMPFSNYAVVIELDKASLLELLTSSAQKCSYGSLMQSGLRVTFKRACATLPKTANGIDTQAKLVKVETLGGEVIVDETGGPVAPARTYRVATFDFLADGGSGYSAFKRGTNKVSLDIARDMFAEQFLRENTVLSDSIDGRWKEAP